MRETPILLLTGYLGSGKTTLVNNILSNKKGIKFAVIVNDIGEVNIDASLIQKGGVVGQGDDSLMALQNGCICCTLKLDLARQLLEIAASRKFDYIVIEASGICEPEPIARTICSIPYMTEADFDAAGIDKSLMDVASSIKLDCITTVVDALRMKDEFGCAKNLLRPNLAEDDIENLVIQQIEFCNLILLNKASELSSSDLAKVRKIVSTIQPKAEIIECDYAEVGMSKLLETGLFDYESVSASAAWITAMESEVDEDEDDHEDDHDEEHHHDEDGHDHDEEHHHHHHHHDEGETEEYGIGTYVYYARKPMDINKFDSFVAKHWPLGIIRAKGVCYFESEPETCYLFEQAGTQISLKNIGQWYATMPQDELLQMIAQDPNLARDWDSTYGDRMQKLVFIGQNLDKKAIKEALDFCLGGDMAF